MIAARAAPFVLPILSLRGKMSEPHELKYSDLVQGIPERRFVRARDVKRLVSRINKLSLVMQVSRSLMGAIDLKKLLSEILSKARVVMNADKASIFMIDEARNEIYASVTLDGSEIRLPRGSGIIGYVADSGETVNIPDAYEDSRFNRDNDRKIGYRTRAILCMPVHNQQNKIIGALQVLNKLDGGIFTSEDDELLTAFTAMVGVCLENARAYEELAAERNSLEDKVVERTAELALAKAETDQILQAVEEGLFLLYKARDNYIIGAGHSDALATIFEQKELRSKNFLNAIATFLEAAVIDKTRLFLELMFDAKKQQAVLLKLNPLGSVQGVFPESGSTKYLRFRFDRVLDEGKPGSAAIVDHLMVTVSDISHEVALRQKLERTEEQNRRHMELLLAILQSEPATLSEFLNDLNLDLEQAKQLLVEDQDRDSAARHNMLIDVYRIVHSIKGNSSLLNFQSLTGLAHQTESQIDQLLQMDNVTPAQLAGITGQLDELAQLSEELRSWLEKIATFQAAISGQKKTDFLLRSLQSSLDKAAVSQKKEILFETKDFQPEMISPAVRKSVKDMLLQLVRNSAIHGIETPDERQAAGKPPGGRVVLRSEQNNGRLEITLEDDGRGIDIERVAEQLLHQQRVTPGELAAMSESDKLRLIFAAGVSTHDGVSEFAGRGMGMSIVSESARQIGAEISVESVKGQFTRFVITL